MWLASTVSGTSESERFAERSFSLTRRSVSTENPYGRDQQETGKIGIMLGEGIWVNLMNSRRKVAGSIVVRKLVNISVPPTTTNSKLSTAAGVFG